MAGLLVNETCEALQNILVLGIIHPNSSPNCVQQVYFEGQVFPVVERKYVTLVELHEYTQAKILIPLIIVLISVIASSFQYSMEYFLRTYVRRYVLFFITMLRVLPIFDIPPLLSSHCQTKHLHQPNRLKGYQHLLPASILQLYVKVLLLVLIIC